jgi:hypothetical protein
MCASAFNGLHILCSELFNLRGVLGGFGFTGHGMIPFPNEYKFANGGGLSGAAPTEASK